MTEPAADNPIIDGVEDQHGRKWLCFGSGDAVVWIATGDLHSLSSLTLKKLASVNILPITTAAKEKLKQQAQSFQTYRSASLADVPGWTGDSYLLADGTRHSLRGGSGDVIVAFDPDNRYAAQGHLLSYLDALQPIVRDQPLLLFMLAFGYVGPLLRFAPPDMQNPVAELVGAPEKGKSSLARAVAAIWGGDPASSIGTCESWDFSLMKLDELRAPYHHGLLVLDEANKAGDSTQSQAKAIGSSIFRLTDTGSRRRYGDGRAPPPVRQAILSTSNKELRELVGTASDAQQAIITRVLTLRCDRQHGIFDSVPDGYATARAAVEALTAASVAHAGVAGHTFIQELCRYSSAKLGMAVTHGLALKETQRLARLAPDARTSKIIAMTYVAGRIALQLGVLPRPAVKLDAIFARLLDGHRASPTEEMTTLQRLRKYVSDHQSNLIAVDDSRLPLPESVFNEVAGVWDREQERLVISTKHRMSGISDLDPLLRELRSASRLDADDGKFSNKTSRRICQSGRAYFMDLSE